MRNRPSRRAIGVPVVPSMTDLDLPTEASGPVGHAVRPPIDRASVQYLDRVRALYRPARGDTRQGLERFIGSEDVFRHVGMSDTAQPMMQCPSHWPSDVTWVPLGDLEIMEILEDQDVRAG